MILREDYLNKLRSWKNEQVIKPVTTKESRLSM